MSTELHAFIVTKDTCMAKDIATANSYLGNGGDTQYFIENSDKKNLKPSLNIKYEK